MLLLVLCAVAAMAFARPAPDGAWWPRLAAFDALAAAAALVPPDPSGWERPLVAGWLVAEAVWAARNALRDRMIAVTRGGAGWVLLAAIAGGLAMQRAGPPDGIGAGMAIAAAATVGAAAARTTEGRLGALMVVAGGVLLAGRTMPAVGPWGLLPPLLGRGALAVMLHRDGARRAREPET